MRIDARDFDHLAVALAEVGPRTFKAAAMVTEKAARDIERDAKAFAPVDTGNLRSSIGTDLTVDASRISATIGATTNPAPLSHSPGPTASITASTSAMTSARTSSAVGPGAAAGGVGRGVRGRAQQGPVRRNRYEQALLAHDEAERDPGGDGGAEGGRLGQCGVRSGTEADERVPRQRDDERKSEEKKAQPHQTAAVGLGEQPADRIPVRPCQGSCPGQQQQTQSGGHGDAGGLSGVHQVH